MIVKATVQSLPVVEAQWLVLGLFEDDSEPPESVRGTPLDEILTSLLAAKELSGGLGETYPLHHTGGFRTQSILIVGLGPRERFGVGPAFDAAVAAGKRLASKPREVVAVGLPNVSKPLPIASAITQGMIVGARGPGLHKAEAARHEFGTLLVVNPAGTQSTSPSGLKDAVRRGEIVGQAINLARDLVNTPPSEKSPTKLAERARQVAEAAGITVSVWDEPRIRGERFGGLLGVAAGSDEPPAFVALEYRNGGDRPNLALVGKGVTFDSGGLSLKPTASMEDMKCDMAGAASVLAAVLAAARLELPVNLLGYMVLTENMTGGRAMKLGDVLTMRNGKTVEVLNTDAEGRLILADALSYAVENKPGRVLNLATLTGACMVALGTKIAGLFSNDEAFSQAVTDASRRTGERVWRLPLDDDFRELLKSNVADLKNVGGKWGGASSAAKFLQQFVDQTPWVHLDIAGPSWADTESACRDAGATGFAVRTLIDLIEATDAE